MERIESVSIDAHKWLSEVPTSAWSRHVFNEGVKNDHITNNLTESFNHWVGLLRFKLILTMLEGITTKLMSRLHKRYELGLIWPGMAGPHVRQRLNKAQMDGRKCSLLFAGGDGYDVI